MLKPRDISYLSGACLALLGCGPQHPTPTTVTVSLEDVAIAPTKSSGLTWDCCGYIPADVQTEVRGIRSLQDRHLAAHRAFVVLERMNNVPLIPPEVVGEAQLFVPGGSSPVVSFRKVWQRDTYTPRLFAEQGERPTWQNVPLDRPVRIVGRLWDSDIPEITSDYIGTFSISRDEMLDAVQRGDLYPVYGTGNVLFARISVQGQP